MKRFLYFFPGKSSIDPRGLDRAGCLSRFTRHNSELIEYGVTGINEGPAGSGCIVAAGARPPRYDRTEQQWVEGKSFWVGIEDFPPLPDDLARDIYVDGYQITLADGCVWRVPLVREWDGTRLEHRTRLPRVLKPVLIDGDWKYPAKVAPEYAKLDELASRIFGQFVSQQAVPIAELYANAIALLAANYRIGIEESSLLGLLDQETALRVCALAVDQPRLTAHAQALEIDNLKASPDPKPET